MPQDKTHQNIYDTLAADLIHTSAGARPATIHQWLETHWPQVFKDMVEAQRPPNFWTLTLECRANPNDTKVTFWHSELREFTHGRYISDTVLEADRRFGFRVSQLPALEAPEDEE